MSNSNNNESYIPDGTAPASTRLLAYALFHCDPLREPPFNLELGFSDTSIQQITDCAHIPGALEKLEAYCTKASISKSAAFTLLYPIYLEAMDTDEEDTMHNIAWIIKEAADKYNWNFGRIGGYTDKTAADYISFDPLLP